MDTYREEYENYEPELKVWPFILLGFLVPLVPFVCNMLLANSGIIKEYNFFLCVIDYVIIASSFFVTAHVIRTSHKSWILALEGGFYFLFQLGFWSFYKIKGISGYPLGIPFVIAIIPSFLFILSYAFYAKRSRLPAWGTSSLLSMGYGILAILYIYFTSESMEVIAISYIVFSSLLVLLSFLTLFVTKRSEVAPWYINMVLVLLVFASLLVSPRFPELLSAEINIGSVAIYILESIATSYMLWIMISLCFIYSGLAMKSCFKTLKSLDSSYIPATMQEKPAYTGKNTEDSYQNEDSFSIPSRSSYAFPNSSQDRFSEKRYESDSRYRGNVQEEYYDDYKREERYRSRRRYDSPDYDDTYQDRYSHRYDEPRRDSRDYYDDEDRYYDDREYYDRRSSRQDEPIRRRRGDERPLIERNPKRTSYNNDSYRSSHRRGEEDKWFDLLRGEIDEDEYSHRRDDDYPTRR